MIEVVEGEDQFPTGIGFPRKGIAEWGQLALHLAEHGIGVKLIGL